MASHVQSCRLQHVLSKQLIERSEARSAVWHDQLGAACRHGGGLKVQINVVVIAKVNGANKRLDNYVACAAIVPSNGKITLEKAE